MKFEKGQLWRQRDGEIKKIIEIDKYSGYPLRIADGTSRTDSGHYWSGHDSGHYRSVHDEDERDLIELVNEVNGRSGVKGSIGVDGLVGPKGLDGTPKPIKNNIKIREVKLNRLDEFTTYIENNRDVFKIKDDMSNFNLISTNKSNDILNRNYYIITFSIIE